MTTAIIITLFIVGIILIGLELLVIPGFGISGILGIAALVTGIIFVSDTWYEAMLYSFGTFVILAILVYLSFRFKGTRKMWEKLSLNTRQSNQSGYTAPTYNYADYLGRQGIALTQLRPAGTADFQGKRVDVVTEGGYIKEGSQVKVIAVEGVRIIVREVN
ncbi:MAG: NfeD family protein [Desulfitobacteriaceae bacterium]|nr:NfeD family protein [Desulfitobacteriaceae bacterium]MDD4402242.1 NfeD family protein [Desulfitobacteriaceae bacterium]